MNFLNVITGLPRAGSSVISSILSQNTNIYVKINSPLSNIMTVLNNLWHANLGTTMDDKRVDVLKSVVNGYFQNEKHLALLDHHIKWLGFMPQMEFIYPNIKMIACVRNPADIIVSYENSRSKNPLHQTEADLALNSNSSIATRAMYYAGSEGPLGKAARDLYDLSLRSDRLSRILFVDYDKFILSPNSQLKRIYDFLEIPNFSTHDFTNIYPVNDLVRPQLLKTEVSPLEVIGGELYQQLSANSTFWNAWT